MSENGRFTYDVFLSYSSLDRPWAEQLSAGLRERGITPFFDRESLQVGERWNTQLIAALRASRHLVVLWSNNAKASDWVSQESFRFVEMIADPINPSQPVAGRKIIVLVLEGKNTTLADYQMVRDVLEAGAYDSSAPDTGIGQLGEPRWRRVVGTIADALQNNDVSIPVPLAVLTTTQQRLTNEVDASGIPIGAECSLDSLLQNLEIGTKQDLAENYYGRTWKDWRPFHGRTDIWSILDDTKNAINMLMRDKRFRWAELGAPFYDLGNAGQPAVLTEIQKLGSQAIPNMSVIVIDPLALYDPAVKARFNWMYRCFQNPNALILVLPPVELPNSNRRLRLLIQNLATQVYDYFYQPPVYNGSPYARCGANVGDELDIKHWLLSTLGPQFYVGRERSSPYVQHGTS